ncbi:Solute carrier family 41 member 1 [Halotydeus destructor]|nr:Solute carrier family 41 member 1 [Halotydeus destructor]
MMTVFKSTNCGVHVTHGQKHRELLVGQDSNSTSINATESTPFLIDVTAIPETAIEKPIYERVHWASATFGIVLLVSSMIFFGMKYKSNSELLQLFLTIGLAGFGNLAAGFYLSHVQNWEVFHRVSELLVLEPTLLGLKGNIEMCMAARLSTQANLGNMDTWAKTRSMVAGNLALDLTQAGVVSSVAAIGVVVFAVFQSVTPSNFGYVLSIVLSSTLLTACTASLILGSLLVTVIIVSYKCNVNPDNIGAPIAASCGDVITLVLLANYARLVYNNTPDAPAFPVVSFVAIVCLVSSLPVWAWIAYKNEYTRRNIATGWVPIFIAVLLSTCSGFILDFAAFEYRTYAIFQPVINGVGGNLVAIHSSRMSTALHKQANLGEMPSTVKMYRSPIKAFFDKSGMSTT